MKAVAQVIPWLVVAGVLTFALIRARRRQRGAPALAGRLARRAGRSVPPRRPGGRALNSAVGLVAAREIRERVRGRVFRVGTALILAGIAAAIVIPAAAAAGRHRAQRVGVVGAVPASLRAAVAGAGASAGAPARVVPQAGLTAARGRLRSGRLDIVVVGGREVLVAKASAASGSSATARLAQALSRTLGADEAARAAGLTSRQEARVAHATPAPVVSLERGPAPGTTRTLIVGLVLLVVMLSQYNTWTLIGVMEEKSSRIAEVLLASLRPFQLLAGKLLGIGLVAFAQAALVVGVAAGLAAAVGSGPALGAAPASLAATLVWLLLGYAFYSWVYAAAGSLGERRDQVQGLILPLSLPIFFGYVVAEAAAASANPSTLIEVLAYLPPTAPFAMPVLAGLGAATWWEFALSAALTVVCTAGVARLATGVYRRAILRTGSRVPLREVLGGADHRTERPAPAP